ncbi:winged helix-turn-helix domain-containing protein [Vibrio lentus]|uniref:Transcriptional regulator n=1 Tax=Vibrio lentus TaxID=136468 RepID=A0A855IN04_9VIBR|nr:winged helix-turn-helix domain-containing protein [Vibrio lentus]PMJ65503.1 transcriptional regulator [Vibrio lentus]PMJ82080.1 transcriptional regulator [Vibrio lentus]PMM54823.1 transcriptional regulator [Vibrio lentus]PMM54861.1 transcriptional regulator [Vibrio lentus]PMN37011.1 transcriptional regulator [Vibrio lentus]
MKNQKVQYKFDEWLFVPYEDKFILDGETIVIDNRLSKLFHFLCEYPDTVFSRDELIDEVWNGSILSDQVITQAIFELRKILKQHGNHPHGYIVTVPKRGYKLDATVDRTIEAPKVLIDSVFRSESLETETSDYSNEGEVQPETESAESVIAETKEVEQPEAFNEDPVVEEQAQTSTPLVEPTKPSHPPVQPPKAETKEPKSTNVKKAPLLITVAVLFAVIVSWFFINQNQAPSTHVATKDIVETPSYLSLEPRYIHVIIDDEIRKDDLKVGVIKTLLDFLKTYQDFRIIYDGPAAKLAANEIHFKSSTNQSKERLEIEYFNRISKHKHLDRNYDVSNQALKRSIKSSLDDLLDSFNLDIDKQQIAKLVNELPDDSVALNSILTAHSTTYHGTSELEALELIKQAEIYAPENPYIVASGYIYNLSYLYLNPKQDNTTLIAEQNERALRKFSSFSEEGRNTPRVIEAMVMMALSQDDTVAANSLLNAIPPNRRSVLFYILSAKKAELTGNRDAAEELYYYAVLEASTTLVLDLSEVLFFNSDLSDIKTKIELSSR